MALFYERKETSDEIIIVYKYWALLWIFIILMPISLFMFSLLLSEIVIFLGFIVFSLSWIGIIVLAIGSWRATREIRKAMKQGHVQISGSRFSFSNPITFIIKKEH